MSLMHKNYAHYIHTSTFSVSKEQFSPAQTLTTLNSNTKNVPLSNKNLQSVHSRWSSSHRNTVCEPSISFIII